MPKAQNIAEQFAVARCDYDAAKRTRFKRVRTGVQAQGSHADYHYRTWQAYATILETARDLCRNHMLVGQAVRRLVANILRGGFTLDVKTGDDALDSDLSAMWYAWADSPQRCDRQGESTFNDLARLILQAVFVDGDCVTLPTIEGDLQIIEGHRLRTPTNTTQNVVHGVKLNEFRKRVEYWICGEDVGPMQSLKAVADVKRYSAWQYDPLTGREERSVLHHYLRDRISQTRGVTALAPVIDTAGMLDDLMFAQLVKAQMSACVTVFREQQAGTTVPILGNDLPTEEEARPNGTIRQIAGWSPGMEMFGYPGEKLTGFAPNVPNAEYFQHVMQLVQVIAVNLDLPDAVLLLDPSRTNFSGWRGAMDQARQRFQELQRWLIESFHTPVYRWKVRQWASDDPALRAAIQRAEAASGVDPFGHVWHAQEWPYIEPTQDAMGDILIERNLLSSPRRVKARRGLDYEDVTTEIVDDRALLIRKAHDKAKKLNAELGLELTWQDIAHWPMPEGLTLSLGNPPQQNNQQQPEATNAAA